MISTREVKIRTTSDGQDYMGIKFGEKTEVIIPKYYMPDMEKPIEDLSKEEKKKLKNLVKAWRKYQSRLDTKNNGIELDDGANFDFNTVFQLIQDFLENGIYVEFEKIGKKSNYGRIDFTKTVKRCIPVICDDGPIYMPYFTQTKKVDDENLVRNVQILVLNDIVQKVGWLTGFNAQISKEGIKGGINSSLIPRLKMAKNNSYNSRKLNLINYLIKYLSMLALENAENKELFVSVVYKFWEDMISAVIGNVDKKDLEKIFYIRHRYINKVTKKVYRTSRQMNPLQPDSVYMDGTEISILDSKYYDKHYMPQNDDITKQFAYMRKAFGYFGNSYSYRNIFVMPTDEKSYYSNGVAVFDEDISASEDLVPIEVLYINFPEVVDAYINSLNISSAVL